MVQGCGHGFRVHDVGSLGFRSAGARLGECVFGKAGLLDNEACCKKPKGAP